jgi:potassium/chloride transporter 9
MIIYWFAFRRTLGMEFGGAVGILMWFSSIVGCALFLAACTEGLVSHLGPAGFLAPVLPDSTWLRLGYSTAACFLCLAFCLVGARFLGKIYIIVLALVLTGTAVTAASFFADFEVTHTFRVSTPDCSNCSTKIEEGVFVGIAAASPDRLAETFVSNLYPKYSVDCSDWNVPVDYFVCFAVLFSGMHILVRTSVSRYWSDRLSIGAKLISVPCVNAEDLVTLFAGMTGIMSGANMSADLRHPGRDIPRGTLSALVLAFVILVVLALLTALTCDPVLLQRDCFYISTFSFWPPIVFVGLMATAFSSSLNKLIGASRLLEAMAKDVVFGPFLSFVGKFTTSGGNPVSAVIFSWFFVQAFLFMGSLNAIAQLACIFNLLSYFMVNLACLGLELASAPNFRPLFTFFSWQSCLIGLVGSTVMMFLVSPLFAG